MFYQCFFLTFFVCEATSTTLDERRRHRNWPIDTFFGPKELDEFLGIALELQAALVVVGVVMSESYM